MGPMMVVLGMMMFVAGLAIRLDLTPAASHIPLHVLVISVASVAVLSGRICCHDSRRCGAPIQRVMRRDLPQGGPRPEGAAPWGVVLVQVRLSQQGHVRPTGAEEL